MNRLATIDPRLAGLLDHASAPIQNEVIRTVLSIGSQRVADLPGAARAAMRQIREGSVVVQAEPIETLRKLADEADEEYFKLQEEGAPESQWFGEFQRARVLSALVLAFEGGFVRNAAEIVYEICAAVEQTDSLLGEIRRLVQD